MSCPITHVVVQDTPPPNRVVTVAHLYPIPAVKDEVIFRTVDEEAEAKVVRKRGQRVLVTNEDAETK